MAGPAGGVTRVRTDLAYYGVVTRVISATQFVAAGLAGLGDGALVGYAAYVLAKANGTITAPHAEQPAVSAYVSSSGTFTHTGYTVPLAVGDQLLLLHPNISTIPVAWLAAILAAIGPAGFNQGLCYYGVVTFVPVGGQFTIPTLAGLGAGKFTEVGGVGQYYASVFREHTGASAAPQGESQVITGYATGTGNFTANPFTVDVDIGDEILIIHPFLARIMNFAGVPGTNGNRADTWGTSVFPAEATLCTIGAPGVRLKVHNLTIGIGNLDGNITIRLYTNVNGAEQCIFPVPGNLTFIRTTDQTAIVVINGTFGIKNALRVTIQSDNAAADDGEIVEYDYLVEAM